MRDRNLLALLREAERIAVDEYDGHLTLMRFTSHWKGAFGTPDLYRGPEGRYQVRGLTGFPGVKAMLENMIKKRESFGGN